MQSIAYPVYPVEHTVSPDLREGLGSRQKVGPQNSSAGLLGRIASLNLQRTVLESHLTLLAGSRVIVGMKVSISGKSSQAFLHHRFQKYN